MIKTIANKLVLLCMLTLSINSQLERCGDLETLGNNKNFLDTRHNWKRIISLSNFLKTFRKIGGGAFGSVYEMQIQQTPPVNAKSQYYPSFDAALKYVEYQDSELVHIEKEISFFQYVTKIHPLYLLQYYNCAADTANNRFLVLTEKFDHDLKKDSFVKTFRGYCKNFQNYAIQIFLMMAIGVKNLHMTGYGHFDIKPANFMIKNGSHRIVKIIDYGMVTRPGEERGNFGSYSYMAPEMIFSNPYITTRKSDLYSLGITFYALIYGIEGIAVTRKEQMTETALAQEYFNGVQTVIENKLQEETNKVIRNEKPKDKETRIALRQLIVNLTKHNPDDRINIVNTVEELERLLMQYDEDSIFLERNAVKLFNSVYPNYQITKNFPNGLLKPSQPYKPKNKGISFNFLKPKTAAIDRNTQFNLIDELRGNTFVDYPKEIQGRNNKLALKQNAMMNLETNNAAIEKVIDKRILV